MAGSANTSATSEYGSSQAIPQWRDPVTLEESTFRWSDWSSRIAQLNAPRGNGATLIEPPVALAGEIAQLNQKNLHESAYDVQGRSLIQLAADAREQLLADALRYTRKYRDVDVPTTPGLVFLAGHQPEMFHPGVWFKNFVLARLARESSAVAVNLQIDSDALKGTAVRVPGGSLDQPRLESMTFDRVTQDEPFEQRVILDRPRFESFGTRAAAHLRTLIPDPLLHRYWPLVVARSHETANLGACIGQARHQLEAAWGLQTLEVPQSRVCDLPAMRWLIGHLLAHLPRLWEVYNSALFEFRHEHKVRSAAHPAPDLAAVDQWLEAPLWIWSTDDPRRRRLFVCQRNDELILSDRGRIEVRLAITADGNAGKAVEQLAALSAQGIRLRTRALITTLAARILLGDLFVHGIGGAKYDRLTDRIIELFFGLEPPGYLVASGTLRLPVAQDSSAGELRAVRQKLRELDFHPERFLLDGAGASMVDLPTVAAPIAEKRRWISELSTPSNARQRGQAIRQANLALQGSVAGLRDTWNADLARLTQHARSESVLSSRGYAFSFFPEMILTDFLLPVLEIPADSG